MSTLPHIVSELVNWVNQIPSFEMSVLLLDGLMSGAFTIQCCSASFSRGLAQVNGWFVGHNHSYQCSPANYCFLVNLGSFLTATSHALRMLGMK